MLDVQTPAEVDVDARGHPEVLGAEVLGVDCQPGEQEQGCPVGGGGHIDKRTVGRPAAEQGRSGAN